MAKVSFYYLKKTPIPNKKCYLSSLICDTAVIKYIVSFSVSEIYITLESSVTVEFNKI